MMTRYFLKTFLVTLQIAETKDPCSRLLGQGLQTHISPGQWARRVGPDVHMPVVSE